MDLVTYGTFYYFCGMAFNKSSLWLLLITLLLAACQQNTIPENTVTFSGMITMVQDTLYYTDCDNRELQWIAGGTAYNSLLEEYAKRTKDEFGFVRAHLQGLMEDVSTGRGDTVIRGLHVYVIDSLVESETCLYVDATKAAGKYTARTNKTNEMALQLVLGFNGYAMLMASSTANTREPGSWTVLSDKQIQLVLNESDTLTGTLTWQQHLSLTGKRFAAPITLLRQK